MNDNKGHIESTLSELGKKIDELVDRANESSGDIKKELEVKIEEFKTSKSRIEEEFSEFKKKSSEKWPGVKVHFENAFSEIKKGFGKILSEDTPPAPKPKRSSTKSAKTSTKRSKKE